MCRTLSNSSSISSFRVEATHFREVSPAVHIVPSEVQFRQVCRGGEEEEFCSAPYTPPLSSPWYAYYSTLGATPGLPLPPPSSLPHDKRGGEEAIE